MVKMQLFFMIFLLSFFFTPGQAHSQMNSIPANQYFPPQDIRIEFKKVADERGAVRFEAFVESLVGQSSNTEVFFDGSSGLNVQPTRINLGNLKERKPKKKIVLVSTQNGNDFGPESWIKMRVSYHPDFPKIQKFVNEKREKYPDQWLRKRLLESLGRRKATGKPVVRAVSVFPKEDESLQDMLSSDKGAR